MTIPAAQSAFYKKYLGRDSDNSCSTAPAQFEKNRRFKRIRITEELTTSQVLLARSRQKIELARKQVEAKSRQELKRKAQVESIMLKEVDAFVVAVVSKKEKFTGGKWICVSHYDHFQERSLGKIIGWKQKRIDNVILYLRQNRRKSVSVFQKCTAGHYRCREELDIYTVAKNTGLYVKDVCSRGDWWCFFESPLYGTPGQDVQLTETKSFTRTNINKQAALLPRRKEPNSPSYAAEPASSIASPHSSSLLSSADSTEVVHSPSSLSSSTSPVSILNSLRTPTTAITANKDNTNKDNTNSSPAKRKRADVDDNTTAYSHSASRKRKYTLGILETRTRNNRIQKLTNAFKQCCDLHDETDMPRAALGVASALFREEGTQSSLQAARAAIDVGNGITETECDVICAAAIRSNLWYSTRAYQSLSIVLKRIFGKEILPTLKQVKAYEELNFPRNLKLDPSPKMHSLFPDALPLWTANESNSALRKVFKWNNPYETKSQSAWKYATEKGTYMNTACRKELPDLYGFILHAEPFMVDMLNQRVPELEPNVTAYMKECYDTEDPAAIQQILHAYKCDALVCRGIDGLGCMGEQNQVIGLGDHQLRATVKMLRIMFTPWSEVGTVCKECGNSGLSKELQHDDDIDSTGKKSKQKKQKYRSGCSKCGRWVGQRELHGNSSHITPDYGCASGNESNHTVYDIFFGHCEAEFQALVGQTFKLLLPVLGVEIDCSLDIVNSMFDIKALQGIVGVAYFGHNCMCLGGCRHDEMRTSLGSCKLLTMAERTSLGKSYEEYIEYSYGGNHNTIKPKKMLRSVRNFITSSPMSLFFCLADTSHQAIAMGTMSLELLYREAAKVYIGHRGSMGPEQKVLLDEAEKQVDKHIEIELHRAVKMMHDGNMARDLLDPNNRDVLLNIIPLHRRPLVNTFLDGINQIFAMTRASNPEPGSWIGWKDGAVEFAEWLRDFELSYLGWGQYFHLMIEHTEEYQTRVGGMLGPASAESQEAGNKEGRKIKRVKSRQNFASHEDTVTARLLWCNKEMNNRYNDARNNIKITNGVASLLPASRLKHVKVHNT
jgi:hypothetical protein